MMYEKDKKKKMMKGGMAKKNMMYGGMAKKKMKVVAELCMDMVAK